MDSPAWYCSRQITHREWSYSDSCSSLVVMVVVSPAKSLERFEVRTERRRVGLGRVVVHMLSICMLEWFSTCCYVGRGGWVRLGFLVR